VVVRVLTLIFRRPGSWHSLNTLLRMGCGKVIGAWKVNSGRSCACARGGEAHEMSQLICL
jgi:hypothetical protein